MSTPIIISVPHNGTRFLMKRLDIEHHIHAHRQWTQVTDAISASNGHIIVPLRAPIDVWESWCRRNMNQAWTFPYAELFMGWAGLHAIGQIWMLDVICVDKQTDPRISDWGRVGQYEIEDAADFSVLPIDLRPVYELPLIQQHYEMPDWANLPYNPYNHDDREERIREARAS